MRHEIKRAVSIILCYVIILTMLPLSAVGVSAATVSGNGTESSPYLVSSEAELTEVLTSHNEEGVYIRLTKNITLSENYVPGILNASFDGGFYSITAKTNFFTVNNGILKNFTYICTETRVNVSGSSNYAGIVCDWNKGTISGVIATGHIDNDCEAGSDGTHYAYAAGIICGSSSGTVVNCATFGSVKMYCPYGSEAGGITAFGVVTNCYAAVDVSATGSSKYGSSRQNPITLGTVTNSYYNSDIYVGSAVAGATSSEDMKTQDFVDMLNGSPVTADSIWERDISNINSGYPVLKVALNATITSSKTNVLLEGTESVSLTCSDSGAEIYYTLDGSVPTTGNEKYTSAISIDRTVILTVIAYKAGVYSSPVTFMYANVNGNGTYESPYEIDSEPALHAIPELENDACYCLTRDITLKNELISIGDFYGNFDGCGYTIYDVVSSSRIAGFTAENYGVVENLTFKVKEKCQLVAYAAFAEYNYGVIYNCHFEGILNTKDAEMHDDVGGITSVNYGLMDNCSFEGPFLSDCAGEAGGLAGTNNGKIIGCDFTGEVIILNIAFGAHTDFQGHVGGAVGYNSGELYYTSVTATRVFGNAGSYTGVIVGPLVGSYYTVGQISDCVANVENVEAPYNYLEWGTIATLTYPDSGTVTRPESHDHLFTGSICDPVCGEYRYAVITCSCGIYLETEPWYDDYWYMEHDGVWTETEVPTCTHDGTTQFVCSVCGYTEEDVVPAYGQHYYFKEVEDGSVNYVISNSGTYPFNLFDGWYMSSNYSNSTTSEFKITAQKDFTLELKYYVSSEPNFDKLIIKNGSTVLDSVSGVISEKYLSVDMRAGDVLTIQYTKDSSTSKNSDQGYFMLVTPDKIDDGNKEKVFFTPEDSGCTNTVVCDGCGETFTLAHEWDDGVVTTEPTHLTEGVMTYTCACGETRTEAVARLTSHEWDDGVVTTEPTYTTEGELTYTCACGATYTEAIPVLDNPFVIDENGVLIEYNGDGGDVVIPDGVTAIGEKVFYSLYNITSVTIPNSVTRIGDYAFSYCRSLTSITIPDSVTSIEDYAFNCCTALTSITIPDSVNTIGYSVFQNCTSLTDAVISEGVRRSVGDLMFDGCTALTSITIPASVTSIGNFAFRNCTSLSEVTIPDSVTSIGIYAFQGCTALTTITIPGGIERIESFVFSDCTGLTRVTLSDGVAYISDSAFQNCTGLTSITLPDGVLAVYGSAFEGCNSLESIIIPISVNTIDDSVFFGCSSLTDVYYKGTVEEWDAIIVGPYNTDLTDVQYLHYNVIDPETHYEYTVTAEPTCTEEGMTAYICPCGYFKNEDIIPALEHDIVRYENGEPTCTDIGYEVCEACTRCDYVTYEGSIPALGHDTVQHDGLDATCTEPGYKSYETCTRCDYSTFEEILAPGHNNTEIFGYVAPTCTTIGFTGSTFCHDCKTTIENSQIIPATGHQNTELIGYKDSKCSEDGYSGDMYCHDCGTVLEYGEIIPATGHVNTETFGYVAPTCTNPGYTGVVYCHDCGTTIQNGEIIPADHSYENGSCIYCGEPRFTEEEGTSRGLEFTSNGDGTCYVSGIGTCTDTDIVIPTRSPSGETVTGIGRYAFDDCRNITSVTIPDSVTCIDYAAFIHCSNLTGITIPDGVTSIGEWAFYGCSSLISVIISDGVTCISDYAFSECFRLASITIPNGVTSIGEEAFYACANLKEVTIPDSVTCIEDGAFWNCSGLIDITIPDSVTYIGNSAFAYCTNLITVTIPEGVTHIGDAVFSNCHSLTTVELHDGVISIGAYAFSYCGNIASINLPASVTKIAYMAFDNCHNLNDVYYYGSLEEWNNIFIDEGNDKITNATVYFVPSGDANVDGSVDAADLQLLQRYIAGLSANMDEIAADANGDESIDAADTMIIARAIAGLSIR